MLDVLALRRLRAAGAAACVAALLGTACAPAPSRPREVLAGYLRWIGRDPARTLELLAPEFHARHGLRVADLRDVLWGGWQVPGAAEPPAAAAGAGLSPEARLESGRLAWLFVQRARPLRDARFRTKLLEQDWRETTGSVLLRVQSGRGRPFQQRFAFARRDAGSAWRILGIEQQDVDATNALAAFAAYPSLANLERIQQAAGGGGAGPPR